MTLSGPPKCNLAQWTTLKEGFKCWMNHNSADNRRRYSAQLSKTSLKQALGCSNCQELSKLRSKQLPLCSYAPLHAEEHFLRLKLNVASDTSSDLGKQPLRAGLSWFNQCQSLFIVKAPISCFNHKRLRHAVVFNCK